MTMVNFSKENMPLTYKTLIHDDLILLIFFFHTESSGGGGRSKRQGKGGFPKGKGHHGARTQSESGPNQDGQGMYQKE